MNSLQNVPLLSTNLYSNSFIDCDFSIDDKSQVQPAKQEMVPNKRSGQLAFSELGISVKAFLENQEEREALVSPDYRRFYVKNK